MKIFFEIAYFIMLMIGVICFFTIGRQKSGKTNQTILLLDSFIQVAFMGYWFKINSNTLEEFVLSQKMIYVGVVFLYYYTFVFYTEYCHIHVKKIVHIIMQVCNFTVVMSACFMDKSTLLYKRYYLETRGEALILRKEYGPVHTLFIAIVAMYTALSFFIVLNYLKKYIKTKKRQSALLYLVVFTPSMIYLVDKAIDSPYEITPFGILIGLLMIIYLTATEKIYDFNETVKDFVFATVEDALMIADHRNIYKGCNNLALSFFPELATVENNTPIDKLSDRLKKIFTGEEKEFIKDGRIYEVTLRPIDTEERVIGTVVWIENVTSRRERLASMKNYQDELEKTLQTQSEHIQSIQERMLIGTANIVENRDLSTGGHIKRTSEVVRILVSELAKDNIFYSDEFYEMVIKAAPLHDIGKIAIPDAVLSKPGRFTIEEYSLMKKHAEKGAVIVEKILDGIEDDMFVSIATNMAHYHHERWDGGGYPKHLIGRAIPFEARIMAVADVYDALVSKRCYKEAMPYEEAFNTVVNLMGKDFDPALKESFIRCKERLNEFYDKECANDK